MFSLGVCILHHGDAVRPFREWIGIGTLARHSAGALVRRTGNFRRAAPVPRFAAFPAKGEMSGPMYGGMPSLEDADITAGNRS